VASATASAKATASATLMGLAGLISAP
jgi:hypothetical protein